MRSAAILALVATGAIAGSVHHKHLHAKKDVVIETDYDIVYTTVYVNAGEQAPAATPAPASTTSVAPPPPPPAPTSVVSNVNLAKAKPAPSSVYTPPAPVYTPSSVAPAPVYTPSSVAPAPAYTPPPAPAYADSYQNAVVEHHNVHRANHSAPAMVWDDNLAAIAQTIGNSCKYAHDVTTGGGGYGQNIAAGVHADNVSTIITDMFYNGEMPQYAGYYGAGSVPDNVFEGVGHFTQLVWVKSTKVGCATVDCSSRGLGNVDGNVAPYFTVCNYSPAGNMLGEFGQNVNKPQGKPSVYWNYLNSA